jgi:hypothetical protein
VKFLRSRNGRIVAGIVLVLALFLVRPGAQRLRTRIVRSISLALGRQVEVGSVSLRLLPQPGFDLQNFVVYDDPAFGAEPALQSSDVVALVRVSSLFRGRLEIARLSLTEPSLNLVRNSDGRWNLENLVERAARTAVAPTAKTRNEARPGFPYIEAQRGRFNIKFGQEKKPYALTDATFALWQDSENTWGLRLRAQPVRTDFNLSDLGFLEIDGSWQRAANLHETPVQFAFELDGAQLGQATKLTWGEDKGWRGAVNLSAALAGTPKDLTVDAQASIDDFRRYDIAGDRTLRLAAHCSGHYSSADSVFSRLDCRAPVGDGGITVNGNIAALAGAGAYDLTLLTKDLPVQPLIEFLGRVKKNVPDGIAAAGKLNANVRLRREVAAGGTWKTWQGGGEVLALNVKSPLTNTKFALDRIPFVVSDGGNVTPRAKRGRDLAGAMPVTAEPRIDIGPFGVALGGPANAVVRGQLSRSGYSFLVQGDSEVQRLLEVARTVGLPAPQPAANGESWINLQVGGSWAGFAPPTVTGTAQLRSVQARVRGLSTPVEIASANILLAPNTAEVQKLTVSAAGNTWRGWFSVPRPCETPRACLIRFDLHADEISTGSLNAFVTPAPGKQPWYQFLSPPVQPLPYLASVHAVGKLTATRVPIRSLVASRVSAEAELEQGRLRLTNLRGDVLGGRHTGEWTANFAVNPPTYSASGTVEKMALGLLADAMNDGWVTGTASVAYRTTTNGWGKAELFSNADASLQVQARDGSLPHVALGADSGPLRVTRFEGRFRLRDGKFQIDQGKLQTPGGIYQVSGTASLSRILDIKLSREGTHGFSVTGTLTQPHVAIGATPETQAALKP